MNKAVIGVVVVILVAAVGAGVYMMQNLDGIVKDLVEQVGTETTGTAVTVGDLKLNLGEGSAMISDLRVANPPGFSNEDLLSLGSIKVAIDTASLAEAVYVINEISVSGVRVLAEQKGTGTNVQALMDNMAGNEPTAEGDAASGAADDVLLAIGQINFADGQMELRTEQYGSQNLTLESLSFRNLGSSENGLTPDEVGMEIAGQLTQQVQRAVTRALEDYLKEQAESKLKEKLGDLFK